MEVKEEKKNSFFHLRLLKFISNLLKDKNGPFFEQKGICSFFSIISSFDFVSEESFETIKKRRMRKKMKQKKKGVAIWKTKEK